MLILAGLSAKLSTQEIWTLHQEVLTMIKGLKNGGIKQGMIRNSKKTKFR
jgi:hypothetical protein